MGLSSEIIRHEYREHVIIKFAYHVDVDEPVHGQYHAPPIRPKTMVNWWAVESLSNPEVRLPDKKQRFRTRIDAEKFIDTIYDSKQV